MYLTQSDFIGRIKESNLQLIIQNDSQTLLNVMLEAQSRVEQYLYERYNIASEFALTGESRNTALVGHTVNIARYFLFQRLPGRMTDSVIVENDYTDSTTELRMIAKGKMSLNIARKDDGNGKPKTRFRWGSAQPKRML